MYDKFYLIYLRFRYFGLNSDKLMIKIWQSQNRNTGYHVFQLVKCPASIIVPYTVILL